MTRKERAIGPALEIFLGVVGLALLIVAAIGLLTKPFWKRIAAFFRRWIERDRRLEEQRRFEEECRRKALLEVSDLCHDDIRNEAVCKEDVQIEIPTAVTGKEEFHKEDHKEDSKEEVHTEAEEDTAPEPAIYSNEAASSRQEIKQK